jgi:hypothetical protein
MMARRIRAIVASRRRRRRRSSGVKCETGPGECRTSAVGAPWVIQVATLVPRSEDPGV